MKIKTVNVVLVEDEKVQQDMMSEILIESVGVDTVTCKDSAKTFKDYMDTEKGRLDTQLIMLDIKIGDDNGLELLSWLKQQLDLADIPVCIVTGSTDGSDMNEARELGADVYMRKPLNFSMLKHVIYELPMFKTVVCLA
jgi:DNA-binding response OmpR family regulator